MPDIQIIKGQPLTLPNGDVIVPKSLMTEEMKNDYEQSGKDTEKKANNAVSKARDLEIQADLDMLMRDPFEQVEYRRTLADVPDDYKRFSTVIMVVGMSMWGLTPIVIARVCNVEEERIVAIMETELFVQLRRELVEAMRYSETGNIHSYLQAKAAKAAVVIAVGMNSANQGDAMTAAKDILDRSGYRPVDRVEHSVRFEDELRIVHMEEKEIQTINMDDL